jgi:hypothetical protein
MAVTRSTLNSLEKRVSSLDQKCASLKESLGQILPIFVNRLNSCTSMNEERVVANDWQCYTGLDNVEITRNDDTWNMIETLIENLRYRRIYSDVLEDLRKKEIIEDSGLAHQ